MVNAGYFVRFRPDPRVVVAEYLFEVLRSSIFKGWLQGTRREGIQANVNAREYESFPVPLPALAEQRRIAEILGAADTEIALHNELITHLRAQKRSLREQLLTGKFRLPHHADAPSTTPRL